MELILRTEEVFGISFPDAELIDIRTIGDFYHLILSKLDLPYVTQEEAEASGQFSRFTAPVRPWFKAPIEHPVYPDPNKVPWTSPEVWLTLKAVIQDQLQVRLEQIVENATFLEDLGCD